MVQELEHCETRINDLRLVEHLHHAHQSVLQPVAVHELSGLVAARVTVTG